MATYLILNVCFILLTVALLRFRIRRPTKQWLSMLVGLLTLTAVFDSIIVGLDIVGYSADKILGLYIGNAPVEDFFYALLAAILIPVLWNKLGDKHVRKN